VGLVPLVLVNHIIVTVIVTVIETGKRRKRKIAVSARKAVNLWVDL
jgi:hypothetical protein